MKSRSLLAALVLAAGCTNAEADVHKFCVGTDAQLEAALAAAPGLANVDSSGTVEIRLRRRPGSHYLLSTVPDTLYGLRYGNINLRGGYSSELSNDCTEVDRLMRAEDTRIVHQPDADDSSRLELHTTGDLTIEGISFDVPSGLYIAHYEPFARISFLSNIVESSGDSALLIDSQFVENENSIYRIVNNLVFGVPMGGSCAVRIRNSFGGEVHVEVVNNTIADNAEAALCYRNLTSIELHNNIFWGNLKGVIDADPDDPSPITLRYNLMQSGNALPGIVDTHDGYLSSDPGFTNGYRLSPASPAVNSGSPRAVPGGLMWTDLDGNDRTIGVVDRGAYESADTGTGEIAVTTTGDTIDVDTSKTSLREAILFANAQPGPNRIVFDIGSPHICSALLFLDSPLPEITETLEIDGFTQGPSHPNTLQWGYDAEVCVSLLSSGLAAGLSAQAGDGASLTVRGLQIAGFQVAIKLAGGSGHLVEGNVFGSALLANEINVRIFAGVSGTLIGGYEPQARNLLSSAQNAAVFVEKDATANAIVGNAIRPRLDGEEDPELRNRRGVVVLGSGNQIAGNQIFSSEGTGLTIYGNDNIVSSNHIASNETGIILASEGAEAAAGNLIAGNEVAYNAGAGIEIKPFTLNNRIIAGSIHDNGGLGIDIEADGQTQPNDTDVLPSTAGNRGQNYPVLLGANVIGDVDETAQVLGLLSSGNGSYVIRFYASDECDVSQHGEGEEFVGLVQVTIDNATQNTDGSVGFSTPLNSLQPFSGRYLSATATDQAGNTSEFSRCRFVGPDLIFGDGFE